MEDFALYQPVCDKDGRTFTRRIDSCVVSRGSCLNSMLTRVARDMAKKLLWRSSIDDELRLESHRQQNHAKEGLSPCVTYAVFL